MGMNIWAGKISLDALVRILTKFLGKAMISSEVKGQSRGRPGEGSWGEFVATASGLWTLSLYSNTLAMAKRHM